jgi:hypothetical protein
MPHKETAVRCCDDLDPIARVISRHIHFACHFIGFLRAARVTFGKKNVFPRTLELLIQLLEGLMENL